VDTTGSSAGPQPVTTAPEDWTQHPLVQVEGGFIGGLALGLVPFGGVIAGAISGPGSRWAEIGRGVGEIFGGGIAFAAGMAGIVGGGAASGTGVLTIPGVLAVAGSAALVAGGVANVKAGAERLGQALSMSSGSGSSGPPAAASTTGGARTPRTATQTQREAALERSKGADGVEKCTYCSKPLDRKSGTPNSAEIDHRRAYSKGGETVDSNLDAACRTCNRSKGNKDLGTEWVPPKQRQP